MCYTDSMSKIMRPIGLVLLFSLNAFAGPSASIELQMRPGSPFTAKTESVQGSAKRVGNTLTADRISLTVSSLRTGKEVRDEHMINKYFEATRFPDAVMTGVRGENGKFTGKLKVHGVEQPVSGTYKDLKTEVEGKFPCSIKSFGIKDPRFLSVGVADQVEVTVRVPIAP